MLKVRGSQFLSFILFRLSKTIRCRRYYCQGLKPTLAQVIMVNSSGHLKE